MGSKAFVCQFCNRNIISNTKFCFHFACTFLVAVNKMMAVSCKYHACYRASQIFIMNIPYKPQAIAIVELYLKETARQP